MKRHLIPSLLAMLSVTVLASCAPGITVETPVIFWNRQPTRASGDVNRDVVTDSRFKNIYYVGFDAIQGGELQGQMVVDYVKDQIARGTAWGNAIKAKGELKYNLIIGQTDHNDSAARTAGVRDALGTRQANPTSNANSEGVKEGSITLDDGSTLRVREVSSGEAKNTAGATWDATKAGELVEGWFKDANTTGDIIVSNNDGMIMGSYAKVPASGPLVPMFGYDSNDANLKQIAADRNKTAGPAVVATVNQNAPAQAAAILLAARNIIDGVADPIQSIVNKTNNNGYGNLGEAVINYNAEDHALLVNNFGITAANVDEYVNKTPEQLAITSITKGTTEKKNLFWNIYNGGDTFLNGTLRPSINQYIDKLNFEFTDDIAGDGNSDASVIDRIVNKRDAYLVNPVKPTAGDAYLNKIYEIESRG